MQIYLLQTFSLLVNVTIFLSRTRRSGLCCVRLSACFYESEKMSLWRVINAVIYTEGLPGNVHIIYPGRDSSWVTAGATRGLHGPNTHPEAKTLSTP